MWIQSIFRGHILDTFLCLRTSCQLNWIFIVDRQDGCVSDGLGKEHMEDFEASFNPRTEFVSRHGSPNLMPCILWQRYIKFHKIIRTHKINMKKLLIYDSRIPETTKKIKRTQQEFRFSHSEFIFYCYFLCRMYLCSSEICWEHYPVFRVSRSWNKSAYFPILLTRSTASETLVIASGILMGNSHKSSMNITFLLYWYFLPNDTAGYLPSISLT